MKKVAEEWDNFAAHIYRGINPCDNQREETKRAFFAGYWAMITDIDAMQEADDPQGLCDLMISRREEVREFFTSLVNKQAKRN